MDTTMNTRYDVGGSLPKSTLGVNETARSEASKTASASTTTPSPTQAQDQVELRSSDLMQLVRNAPDTNSARIDALRAQIANGEYALDAGAIAEGMLSFESQLQGQ
jgi:flagellar biosynthesis anti-sigma factor FlgM